VNEDPAYKWTLPGLYLSSGIAIGSALSGWGLMIAALGASIIVPFAAGIFVVVGRFLFNLTINE
jgi:hypothetical protein